MKTIIQVLLLTSLKSYTTVLSDRRGINDDYGEPGILISMNYTNFAYPPINCKNHIGGICHADGRTLMICTGQEIPLFENACETIDSSKPFCIDSKCTSIQGSLNDPFICTSNGIFPDPRDCTRYYLCHGPNQPAEAYQCDESKKLIFSIDRQLCIRKSFNERCQTLNCEKHKNQFISFAKSPSYYAFCGPTIVLFKCLDDENEIFDRTIDKCVFNCKETGYFSDRTSCENYYSCERIGFGRKFRAIKHSCPQDYKFDGIGCVFDPNCKPVITQMSVKTTGKPTLLF